MDQDKIKSMLKKLFAVAENDASADGEIANALASARNLMSAHQIERDDVFEDDNGDVQLTVKYGQAYAYSMYTSLCAWESYLSKFITEFVPGTGYYIETGMVRRNSAGMATKGRCTRIIFYGPDIDVRFAAEIFEEVRTFIIAAARLRFGNALSRGQAAAYAEGFAYGLWQENKTQVKQLEQSSDSTALVVVNRGLAIKKGGQTWLAEEHNIKLHSAGRRQSQAGKSGEAYAQGRTDGKTYQPTSTKKAGYLT